MDIVLKNVKKKDLSLIKALAERLNFEIEITIPEDEPHNQKISNTK